MAKNSLRGHIYEALKMTEGLLNDGSGFAQLHESEPPLPKSEAEVDAFIKERIRPYVETWILPELRRALKKAERK
jgi:hypothetical protein